MLKRLAAIQFFAFAVIFVAFVAPSIQVYLGNIEVKIDYSAAFIQSGYAAIAAATYALICFGALIVSERVRESYIAVLLAWLICTLVQFNFFVWDYGVIDGSPLQFSNNAGFGYAELAFWAAVFVVCLRNTHAVYLNRYYFTLLIVACSLFALAPTLWANRQAVVDNLTKPETAINPGLYAYSKERNIVVWISDGLQADVAQEVLERRPDFTAAMSGFTFFSQAIGHYKFTKFSLPSILSGRLFEGEQTIRSFRDDIAAPNNISAVFSAAGFQTDMVSSPDFCVGFKRCNFMWSDLRGPRVSADRSANLINIALFRIAPHFVKPYVFDGIDGVGSAILAHLSRWTETELHGNTQTNDVFYYQSLLPKLNNGADRPTLKVLHSYSTHHPYVLNKNCSYRGKEHTRDAVLDQAECNASLFVRFLDKLRTMGVYEQTLVVWISDHGARNKFTRVGSGEYSELMSDASVTFAVKPMNADDEFHYSDAPVQLLDIAPTLFEQFGLRAADYPGESVLGLDGQERTRYFFDSTPMTKNKPITFRKYKLEGRKLDPQAWTFLREFVVEGLAE